MGRYAKFILIQRRRQFGFVSGKQSLPFGVGFAVEKKTSPELKKRCRKHQKHFVLCRKPLVESKFCQTKSVSQRKPEKIGSMKMESLPTKSSFRQQNNIDVHSTQNEAKSIFAERNLRSLKAPISRFLHENKTDVNIEHLKEFVSFINCPVNCSTKLALEDVFEIHNR